MFVTAQRRRDFLHYQFLIKLFDNIHAVRYVLTSAASESVTCPHSYVVTAIFADVSLLR